MINLKTRYEKLTKFVSKINAILLFYQKFIQIIKKLKFERLLKCETFEKKMKFFDIIIQLFSKNNFVSKVTF